MKSASQSDNERKTRSTRWNCKTLEAVRIRELAEDVLALPKGKHWYETHELAWVLLQQFMPSLKLAEISSYFAHVNSAKCCMNNAQRREAADILFENCRAFIPTELGIRQQDIIVSQGKQARKVLEQISKQRGTRDEQ